MNLEIFENGRTLKCGVENFIGRTCQLDANALAHLEDFYFDGKEVQPLPKSESIISICPIHRSRLEIKFREFSKSSENVS
jgi:hypothetical protein